MYIYNTHTHTHYTGHALEIEKLGGAKIVVDGSSYTLREMVTHTPSEHRIHGQAMDLELQLVHVRFFFCEFGIIAYARKIFIRFFAIFLSVFFEYLES